MSDRRWTGAEVAMLKDRYRAATMHGDLRLVDLAESLGRLKSNVSRKARQLGLTNQRRRKVAEPKRRTKWPTIEQSRAAVGRAARERFARGEHPRGMLGKRHTPETRARLSASSTAANARVTNEQMRIYTLKGLRTRVANGTYAPPHHGTTWKAGWREIGGTRRYYRSKWEANYAHYLEWQRSHGLIAAWQHEPVTFWFEGVKRGCVSYLPDFLVKEKDGSECYHEVKGWMDERSKTKIRRMAKHHPTVRLVVIDARRYAALRKSVAHLVPGWES